MTATPSIFCLDILAKNLHLAEPKPLVERRRTRRELESTIAHPAYSEGRKVTELACHTTVWDCGVAMFCVLRRSGGAKWLRWLAAVLQRSESDHGSNEL